MFFGFILKLERVTSIKHGPDPWLPIYTTHGTEAIDNKENPRLDAIMILVSRYCAQPSKEFSTFEASRIDLRRYLDKMNVD